MDWNTNMNTQGSSASGSTTGRSGGSHNYHEPDDIREPLSYEGSNAQNHYRNASGSSSVYFDAVDTREGAFSAVDQPGTRSQIGVGRSRSTGKERSRTGSDAFQDPVEGVGYLASQSSSRSPVNDVSHHDHTNAAEQAWSRIAAEDVPSYSAHTESSISSDSFGDAYDRMPTVRQRSFGAEGKTDEDRRNWERIQAIAGASSSRQNYMPRPLLTASSSSTIPRGAQKRKSSSSDSPGLDGSRPSVSSHPSYRPPPYEESLSHGRTSTLPPRTHQIERDQSRHEMIVPRWQPDAEVTFCPICATQFSFFVRKHHCRKCGRVVCSSCSPHRITIPHQFIVQPPAETNALTLPSAHNRPNPDLTRSGSSAGVENLGGGERVRLCNPCVPDPNNAPPQTPQYPNQPQRIPANAHIRSTSSANALTAPRQPTLSSSNPSNALQGLGNYLQNARRQARQPSVSGRPGNPASSSSPHVYTHRNSDYSDHNYSDSRIRSATVSGSGLRQDANPTRQPIPASLVAGGLLTRVSSNQSPSGTPVVRGANPHTSRADPIRPFPQAPRPRIPEEDECPVCHQELPSSQLPNSEALRSSHITTCIENAMGPTSAPPSASMSTSSVSSAPSSSIATRVPVPIPIANTPEARMAAREQAHAAVVLGQRSTPSSTLRRTGVFPYKATEKDCVDDAECTICLEEFEVGQDMGRLECFCRFHLHCIREWFVNHYGQCPVHHQSAY